MFESPFVVVVKAAQDEARRRGDRRLGTEHLFLGLLHDPDATRAIGVDLDTARVALDDLDNDALAAIGIDLGGIRPGRFVPARKRPPLTSNARAALNTAVRASRTRTRHLAPMYLLTALLEVGPPDPVADLVGRLGIDPAAVRERI
jgi:ATP-dependent Clp protease ATP-binding subunit ClpA